MVPTSALFARSEMIPPAAMAPPAAWLASPAWTVIGRRFVAGLWDPALLPEQAAAAASALTPARADRRRSVAGAEA